MLGLHIDTSIIIDAKFCSIIHLSKLKKLTLQNENLQKYANNVFEHKTLSHPQ